MIHMLNKSKLFSKKASKRLGYMRYFTYLYI